jgi:multidrug efflux pump subunit AcrA (membrane-fusion protein)
MKFNLRTKISRKNQLLAVVSFCGVFLTGTLMATAPEHDPTVIDETAWPVTSMAVALQDLAPELRLFGRVETPSHAQLTAGVSASVTSLSVSEGELVEAGQILMTLDDADEELLVLQRMADAAEAEAALETTRRQLALDTQVLKHMQELHQLTQSKSKRLQTLKQQNLVATERLEDTQALVARQAIELAQQQMQVDSYPQRLAIAEAAVQRARAVLEQQELRLARTLILAPFRGRVSEIQASPGNRVREGEVLISMYDTSALQVRVTLPSTTVANIKLAMASGEYITAQMRSEGGNALLLDQLAGAVASGRSGVDGLFTVTGNGDALELGKAVDVVVHLPALHQVAAIPVQSLYGDDRIYGVVDGRLQGVQVTTFGQRRGADGNVELLVRPEGEIPAEILTTSLPRASTGLRVNVING